MFESNIDICLVCPSYLSAMPRVVKEADALAGAGFTVVVIAVQGPNFAQRKFDEELSERRAWRFETIRFSTSAERLQWLVSGIRHRIAGVLPEWCWQWTTAAEYAEGRLFPELLRAACAARARLYIGHLPDGIAAAALAARRNNAQVAFDADDFIAGQALSPRARHRADFLQRRYIGQCAYVTAASAGIAEAVERAFLVPRPTVVYNTFEWQDRRSIDNAVLDRRDTNALSLYWYSQTVGLDRGLQDAIRAVAGVDGSIELHIRGHMSSAVRAQLIKLAADCAVTDRVFFHQAITPEELLSRAAEHDVGLALEPGHSPNNALASSNKMFVYMLAGLAIAATDVPGQASVLRSAPAAAVLYPPGDWQALANHLRRWCEDRTLLLEAKQASLHAARERWNWEREREKLLANVREAIGGARNEGNVRRLEVGAVR